MSTNVKRHGATSMWANPQDVPCPWCMERTRNPCYTVDGYRLPDNRYHSMRVEAAKAKAKADAIDKKQHRQDRKVAKVPA